MNHTQENQTIKTTVENKEQTTPQIQTTEQTMRNTNEKQKN